MPRRVARSRRGTVLARGEEQRGLRALDGEDVRRRVDPDGLRHGEDAGSAILEALGVRRAGDVEDALTVSDDGRRAAEVDVGRGEVADAAVAVLAVGVLPATVHELI